MLPWCRHRVPPKSRRKPAWRCVGRGTLPALFAVSHFGSHPALLPSRSHARPAPCSRATAARNRLLVLPICAEGGTTVEVRCLRKGPARAGPRPSTGGSTSRLSLREYFSPAEATGLLPRSQSAPTAAEKKMRPSAIFGSRSLICGSTNSEATSEATSTA